MVETFTNSLLLMADDGKRLFLFEAFMGMHLVGVDVNVS